MGASYTAVSRIGTEGAALNPTQIGFNAQETFVRTLPWITGQLCDVQDFSRPGTTWTEPQAPALTMSTTALSESATTAMGDVTAAFTMTSRNLTANLYAVDVAMTKSMLEATQGDIQGLVERAGARAAVKLVDTLMCATYTEAPSTGPDHEIGVSGTAIDWPLLLAAQELLMVQQAPGPYTFVGHTTQYSEIMGIEELTHMQVLGQDVIAKGVDIDSGLVGIDQRNIRYYISNNVVNSSGYHAMMFSRQALGLRIKQAFKVGVDASRLDVGERALIIGFEMWFAHGGLRNTSTTNAYMVDLVS